LLRNVSWQSLSIVYGVSIQEGRVNRRKGGKGGLKRTTMSAFGLAGGSPQREERGISGAVGLTEMSVCGGKKAPIYSSRGN